MEDATREFLKYTDKYIKEDSKHILKKEHTLRVVDLCEIIAKNLGLSKDDIILSKLCGLLHDIARFEQLKRYNTFIDRLSIDHGDLGVEILCENNFIRKFNKDKNNDSIILNSVKYHNKYEISDKLNNREKLFTNIVRDADKIDILNLVVKDEIKIDIKDSQITDEVYDDILNNKTIDRKKNKTEADRICTWFGFVYDFNFKYSLKILKEKNYINLIIDKYINYTTNKITIQQLENIKTHINKYLNGDDDNVR